MKKVEFTNEELQDLYFALRNYNNESLRVWSNEEDDKIIEILEKRLKRIESLRYKIFELL